MALSASLPPALKCILCFLIIHLIIITTQVWAVFDYDKIASYKLQEPRILADEAVVQSNRAIGVGDISVMTLNVAAIVGVSRQRWYGVVCTFMVLGVALYWPVNFVATRFTYAFS